MRTLLIGLALVVSSAHAVQAQIPRLVSHQGELTSGGIPLPDGAYDMTFRLYDAPSGGTPLYTESLPAVQVIGGGFSVILGASVPLTLPFDRPYWLGVTLGTDPEMAPRVALTSAPYALNLALPWSPTIDVDAPALTLRNTGPNGEALRVGGSLLIGDDAFSMDMRSFPGDGASIRQFRDGGEVAVVRHDETTDGAQIVLLREAGMTDGAFVDSPAEGGDEPTVTLVEGASMLQLGTMAENVNFPPDAIQAEALLGEPGIVSRRALPTQALTASITVLDSITIDCPLAGYVLAIGTCTAGVAHQNGFLSSGFFGVSGSPTSLPQNQDVAIRLDGPVPTGDFSFPVRVHSLFPATAGAQTFYLNGQEGAAGQFTASNAHLSVMFIPTAYGVVGAAPPAVAEFDAGAPSARVEAGRHQALAAERTRERWRIERENFRTARDVPRDLAIGRAPDVAGPPTQGGDR